MATKIEWCDDVFNPITGCTRVGEGCRNCYCLKQFGRNLWDYGPEITFHPDRLDKPLRRKKPTHYFVCSMGDLFHPDVKDEWIRAVYRTIARCDHHTFTILTKRPDGARKRQPYPSPNLRLYVSVWDQPSADEFIQILMDTPAAVRGISYEPALGPVDFNRCKAWHPGTHDFYLKGIHHVI